MKIKQKLVLGFGIPVFIMFVFLVISTHITKKTLQTTWFMFLILIYNHINRNSFLNKFSESWKNYETVGFSREL